MINRSLSWFLDGRVCVPHHSLVEGPGREGERERDGVGGEKENTKLTFS